MDAEERAGSSQVEGYVAHFAERLIAAPPATAEHVVALRNYALGVTVLAAERAGGHNKVTASLLNDLFNQELFLAAMVNNIPCVPESARMQLTIREWKKYRRLMLSDLDLTEVRRELPLTEVGFLGALATGKITYKSLTNR